MSGPLKVKLEDEVVAYHKSEKGSPRPKHEKESNTSSPERVHEDKGELMEHEITLKLSPISVDVDERDRCLVVNEPVHESELSPKINKKKDPDKTKTLKVALCLKVKNGATSHDADLSVNCPGMSHFEHKDVTK